ncbi:hypothetical protein SEA_MORRIGAN_48 [Microbacterium phage Morrigan]|nr:hypothetical protein SEA_MORRIGAN_48 [Microbacterium phage Morrigan]
MDSKTVHLNGGPWHDRVVAIDDTLNHFHVAEPLPDAIRRGLLSGELQPGFQPLKLRQGTYSQVSGPQYRNEFEWDGWDR